MLTKNYPLIHQATLTFMLILISSTLYGTPIGHNHDHDEDNQGCGYSSGYQNYSRNFGSGNQNRLWNILDMHKKIFKMRTECATLTEGKDEQQKILGELEKALKQETDFLCGNNTISGQAKNAFILAMTNNNPNIHTLSGALVHSLVKPLASTINTVGEQFWGNIFSRAGKMLAPVLISLGFKPAVREQDIDSIKSIADNLKQRLVFLSKQADASFGNGKALNLRLAKQDQYNFDATENSDANNQVTEKKIFDVQITVDDIAKAMFLDLINMGFIEIDICLSKCKIANKKDAVSERLEIMNKRFAELHNLFSNINSIQDVLKDGAFHKVQASCDLIMMLCLDLKCILLDKPTQTSKSYPYPQKRLDDY